MMDNILKYRMSKIYEGVLNRHYKPVLRETHTPNRFLLILIPRDCSFAEIARSSQPELLRMGLRTYLLVPYE